MAGVFQDVEYAGVVQKNDFMVEYASVVQKNDFKVEYACVF